MDCVFKYGFEDELTTWSKKQGSHNLAVADLFYYCIPHTYCVLRGLRKHRRTLQDSIPEIACIKTLNCLNA